MSKPAHYVGVDVGTGSVRAGVFDADGGLCAARAEDITLHQDMPGHAEQSTAEIWRAVATTCRAAMAEAGLSAGDIGGIGFDATCSLVLIDEHGAGLPVGAHGDATRDVIAWMDHRAAAQAERINAQGHRVLDYAGGRISPEMETPKLLWLKENLSSNYDGAAAFFDLTDFLTWKATGSLARSVCTVTCKWTYMAHENAWDESYFRQVGLGDLADSGFARIGTEIVAPGTPLAKGLTEAAADTLGLAPGTPVGAGLIDAHAGGVGAVGAGGEVTTNLVYVFGTSACTMASSEKPLFVPGVWGPYFSAMVPELWLNEGGQSSAGAAIAQLLALHPASETARTEAEKKGLSLANHLAELASVDGLSKAIHLAGAQLVVPDFLGNRAPYADVRARGIIAGLGMEQDAQSLLALYVAGLSGIGYGLRQIVATSLKAGATIESITVIGGAARHPLIAQMLADCTGLPVIRPEQSEPVLLGAAMLGAVASGRGDLQAVMAAMSGSGATVTPAGGEMVALHTRRFGVFEAVQQAARALRDQTEGAINGNA